MTTPEKKAHQADIARIENAENVQDALASHRLARADDDMVTCYCSAVKWRTLDEYGEHLEALILRDHVKTNDGEVQ